MFYETHHEPIDGRKDSTAEALLKLADERLATIEMELKQP